MINGALSQTRGPWLGAQNRIPGIGDHSALLLFLVVCHGLYVAAVSYLVATLSYHSMAAWQCMGSRSRASRMGEEMSLPYHMDAYAEVDKGAEHGYCRPQAGWAWKFGGVQEGAILLREYLIMIILFTDCLAEPSYLVPYCHDGTG